MHQKGIWGREMHSPGAGSGFSRKQNRMGQCEQECGPCTVSGTHPHRAASTQERHLQKDLRDPSKGSKGCFDVLSCDLRAEVSNKDVEMIFGEKRKEDSVAEDTL